MAGRVQLANSMIAAFLFTILQFIGGLNIPNEGGGLVRPSISEKWHFRKEFSSLSFSFFQNFKAGVSDFTAVCLGLDWRKKSNKPVQLILFGVFRLDSIYYLCASSCETDDYIFIIWWLSRQPLLVSDIWNAGFIFALYVI
ncbi:hypothetical protein NE237_023596 [Protea cynaroides]|uniref:Uncharacterized protein n=1 Tax=Protea cynaroides TaxID=273540 RepID=A0A9Q0HGL3_9MAGN|nr:hypothetical protein NE237_023596 [Protea cynaroides]